MKPPRFKYCAAESVEEALAGLDEYGDEAKVLAGGQSLIPLMNMRLARPQVLVDITRIGELSGITANGALTIGAMTRQRQVERSPEVRSGAPLLIQALRFVGHPSIRTRGTLGGSAAHADPASEIPAVLRALDADMLIQAPSGERSVPAADFFVATFETALEDNELLTQILIPPAEPNQRTAFVEVARRHGDFALAGVAVAAVVEEGGAIERARICFTNVAEIPYRAHAAEGFLVGRRIDDAAGIREAAELAVAEVLPPSDLHASGEDRRDIAKVVLRRAFAEIATTGGR